MMAECSLIADEKTNMGLGSWRRKRVDRMEWRVGAVSGSSSRAPWPGERGTVTGSDATCWGGVSAAERPHVAPCSAVQGKRKQHTHTPASLYTGRFYIHEREICLCRNYPLRVADQIALASATATYTSRRVLNVGRCPAS
jgi:hypothetical protein